MVNINLLPWRDAERQYQKNTVKKIFFGWTLLAIVLLFILHCLFTSRQEKSLLHVKQLKQTLNDYQAESTAQQDKRLAANQLHKFIRYADATEQLIRTLAKYHHELCFNEVKREKDVLHFHGKTTTSADLTAFLQHWQAAELFSEIRIKTIERLENHLLQFNFRALADHSLTPLNQENVNNDIL